MHWLIKAYRAYIEVRNVPECYPDIVQARGMAFCYWFKRVFPHAEYSQWPHIMKHIADLPANR